MKDSTMPTVVVSEVQGRIDMQKTYCLATDCSHKSCERHPIKLKGRNPKSKAVFKNYYAVCRRYINDAVKEVRKEGEA